MDDDSLPDLAPGKSVEDLIGKGDDKDGERSDEVCADGIDNDNDGRTDCADFGCRFDAQVSVCRENPGIRFSIVSHITQSFDFQEVERDRLKVVPDTRFSVLSFQGSATRPLSCSARR